MPVHLRRFIVCPSRPIPGLPVKVPTGMAVLSGARRASLRCGTLPVLGQGSDLCGYSSPFEGGYRRGVTA